MQTEIGATGTFRTQLPPALLAELQARPVSKNVMPSDLWQPSIIDRVLQLLVPRLSR
jgi:hypothetical protein